MDKIVWAIACVAMLVVVGPVGATDVYCPKCERHIYTTQDDIKVTPFEPIYFIPTQDTPSDMEKFTCPHDGADLNGYDYWFTSRGRKPPVNAANALTVFTKDDSGNFVWYPYDVDLHDNGMDRK